MEKVSIIIPTYNGGATMPETLASALGQTYEEKEIIIVDDGSTDTAYTHYLEGLAVDERVVHLLHGEHRGPSASRNLGVDKSEGKYILLLDDDDTIESDYVQKAVAILEGNGKADVVYSLADRFGVVEELWNLPPFAPETMLVDNVVFISALFDKKLWQEAGGFDESMTKGLEDYDFWLSLMERGARFYRIPEVLFHCRVKVQSHNLSSANSEEKMVANYQYLYEKHKSLFSANQEAYQAALRRDWIHLRYVLSQPEKGLKQRIMNRVSSLFLGK